MRFFRNKTEVPAFDWRDVWAEEHAHAFTVAKATQAEVVETLRRAVGRALAQGMTYEQFATDITPQLQRLGWWGRQFVVDPETGEEVLAQLGSPRRLQLIYDANIRTAHAAGQWERAQRTKFALPYLLYVETTSAKPRDEHLDQVGTIAHVDDPYWDTWFPPNGWNCKCSVRQVSQLEADALGPRPPPPVAMRDWLNKRTGQIEEIPVGIDPGWHRNPGKLRQQNLDELLSGTLENVDPALRAAALKDLPSSWLFRKIIAGEIDSTPGVPGFFQLPKTVDIAAPIGHFGSEIAASHGGRSGVIWLSGERLTVNPWSHVTADQWALAPRVFDEGAVIRNDGGFLTAYRTIDGRTYRAEIALRNAMVDGTPYTGGARLNLESFSVVDSHLARAEISLANAEGRLVRQEATHSFNIFDLKPSSAGAAATPKGGGQPPTTPGEPIPAKKLPGDSFALFSPEESERLLNAYLDLSKLEQAHVSTYTGNDFMQINWYLRRGDVTVRKGHKLYKAPAAEQDRVRRYIETISKSVQNSVSANLLPEKTVLYRAQFVTDEVIFNPGYEWTDRGFVSASRKLKESFHFHDGYKAEGHRMVMLVIDGAGKKGLSVEKISKVPVEGEVLLPAGTKFRVVGVEKGVRRGLLDKARDYLHVEIVDQADELTFVRRAAQSARPLVKKRRRRDDCASKGLLK
ncbi:MAG: hypothetical protein KDJ37_08690 [Hyphomicrobiaceae bacterium]|nr:hypothetical protein [Hyphomicrobiaceae bacterium]